MTFGDRIITAAHEEKIAADRQNTIRKEEDRKSYNKYKLTLMADEFFSGYDDTTIDSDQRKLLDTTTNFIYEALGLLYRPDCRIHNYDILENGNVRLKLYVLNVKPTEYDRYNHIDHPNVHVQLKISPLLESALEYKYQKSDKNNILH